LQDDLNSLKPYERIKIILELARFVIPQMKSTQLTANVNDKRFQPLVIQMLTEK
jgi:hypothetical protein